MNNEKHLLQLVLEDVNKALTQLGRDPLDRLPCGLRNSDIYCPLAEALSARISPIHANFDNEKVADQVALAWGTSKLTPRDVVLTYALQRFLISFDEGRFSEYLLSASGALQEAA